MVALRELVRDKGYKQLSSVFWWLNLVIFYSLTIPQKEDIILLYIGHHSIPKLNTTQLKATRVHFKIPEHLQNDIKNVLGTQGRRAGPSILFRV